MSGTSKRSTIYFDSQLHAALRLKAAHTNRSVSDIVNDAVREAAEGSMQNVVQYSQVPLVSSDIIGNPHSSIFDSLLTQSSGEGHCRIVSWYDNEWGYSNRCVDLIERLASL